MAERSDDELIACLTRAGAEITEDEMVWLKGCLLDEERPVEAWRLGRKRGKDKNLLVATQVRLLNVHFQDRSLVFCDSVFLGDIVRVVARWYDGWELSFLTAGQNTGEVISSFSEDTKTIMSVWRVVQRQALAAKRNVT